MQQKEERGMFLTRALFVISLFWSRPEFSLSLCLSGLSCSFMPSIAHRLVFSLQPATPAALVSDAAAASLL
jgi:hypothetical protein